MVRTELWKTGIETDFSLKSLSIFTKNKPIDYNNDEQIITDKNINSIISEIVNSSNSNNVDEICILYSYILNSGFIDVFLSANTISNFQQIKNYFINKVFLRNPNLLKGLISLSNSETNKSSLIYLKSALINLHNGILNQSSHDIDTFIILLENDYELIHSDTLSYLLSVCHIIKSVIISKKGNKELILENLNKSIEYDNENIEAKYLLFKYYFYISKTKKALWLLNYLIFKDNYYIYKAFSDEDLVSLHQKMTELLEIWVIYYDLIELKVKNEYIENPLNNIISNYEVFDTIITNKKNSIDNIITNFENCKNEVLRILVNTSTDLPKLVSVSDKKLYLKYKTLEKKIHNLKRFKVELFNRKNRINHKIYLLSIIIQILENFLLIKRFNEDTNVVNDNKYIYPKTIIKALKIRKANISYLEDDNLFIDGIFNLNLTKNTKIISDKLYTLYKNNILSIYQINNKLKNQLQLLQQNITHINLLENEISIIKDNILTYYQGYVIQIEKKIEEKNAELNNQTKELFESYNVEKDLINTYQSYIIIGISFIYLVLYFLCYQLLPYGSSVIPTLLGLELPELIGFVLDFLLLSALSVGTFNSIKYIYNYLINSRINTTMVTQEKSSTILEIQKLNNILDQLKNVFSTFDVNNNYIQSETFLANTSTDVEIVNITN